MLILDYVNIPSALKNKKTCVTFLKKNLGWGVGVTIQEVGKEKLMAQREAKLEHRTFRFEIYLFTIRPNHWSYILLEYNEWLKTHIWLGKLDFKETTL